MAKKNVRDEPLKPQVSENEQNKHQSGENGIINTCIYKTYTYKHKQVQLVDDELAKNKNVTKADKMTDLFAI